MAWLPPERLPTVAEMVAEADLTVSGLPAQKRRLAVALRRHAVAAALNRDSRHPNLVIPGPTGAAKTLLTRAILRASGLPFGEINATTITPTGWTGRDPATMFQELMGEPWRDKGVRAADHRAVMERWGIIVIDEFDKWRVAGMETKATGPTMRDLQAEMLRIAEGDTVVMRNNDSGSGQPFNTHHILFIALGAFEGIHHNVIDDNPSLTRTTMWEHVQPHHVIQYGFMEELIGRFSTILPLAALTIEQMTSILLEQVWPAWQQRATDEDFTLEADPGALVDLAQMALKDRTGARALEPRIVKMVDAAWADAQPGDRIVLPITANEGTVARLEKA